MRAFLEGHMQLSAEDTAASKKLCAAVSCPVLKSCTFAAETSEALATKTAETSLRNTTPLHIKVTMESTRITIWRDSVNETNEHSADPKSPDEGKRYASALARDPQTVPARLYCCACWLHREKRNALLHQTCVQTYIRTHVHTCMHTLIEALP